MEELTGKEVMPEEAPVKVITPEEVPIMHMPPCLEELVWVSLQEIRKLHESSERHKHFEYGLLEEMRKLVTLKGREVALAQGSIMQGSIMQGNVVQGNVMVGKSCVQEKGKKKARELEREAETLV